MNRDVQSRCADAARLVADELIHQSRTASSRFCVSRRSACRGIFLELVEPVFQMRRVPVELYGDLAERVDSSGALRFPVMVLAALLSGAEVERHCDTGCTRLLHRVLVKV